jgi:hypothetical protein
MANPIYRYRLDPTGTNPDNLVVGEVKEIGVLTGGQIYRGFAPKYGPFFSESVVLYDDITNRLLVRGTDYLIVEILEEASMRYAKEIASVILIKNPDVSNKVRARYQTLGDLYQFNAEKVAELYNKVINDNRPVDWVNVLNKPIQYPPSLHQHLITDVRGFEVLVAAIERLRNAIVLSDVPAFEALLDYVLAQVITEPEIINGENYFKILSYERLMFSARAKNFNTVIFDNYPEVILRSGSYRLNFTITNFEKSHGLYWRIRHLETHPADFSVVSGVCNIKRQKSFLDITPSGRLGSFGNMLFYIELCLGSPEGQVIAQTEPIVLKGNRIFDYDHSLDDDYLLAAHNSCYLKRNPTPQRFYLRYVNYCCDC